MTRGKIVFVDGSGIWTSTEYNGDMYEEGYGEGICNRLEKIGDLESYKAFVAEFTEEYGYEEELGSARLHAKQEKTEDGEFVLDFRSGVYFDDWFSDYLYVKNGGDKPVYVRQADAMEKPDDALMPGDVGVYIFGNRYLPGIGYYGNKFHQDEEEED